MDSKELPRCMLEHVLQVAPGTPAPMAGGLLGRHTVAPGEQGTTSGGSKACCPRRFQVTSVSSLKELLSKWERSPKPGGFVWVSGSSSGGRKTVPLLRNLFWGPQTCVKLGSALMTIS